MRASLPLFLASLALPAAAQSSAYVEQVGANNEALLTQTFLGGSLNEASIRQAGGSTADAVQRGSGNLLAGFADGLANPMAPSLQFDGSRLVLSQDGIGNQAFVEQRNGAFAQILQSGSGNLAFVLQSGGAGNQAYIDQTGDHYARITQNGANNIARIAQGDL